RGDRPKTLGFSAVSAPSRGASRCGRGDGTVPGRTWGLLLENMTRNKQALARTGPEVDALFEALGRSFFARQGRDPDHQADAQGPRGPAGSPRCDKARPCRRVAHQLQRRGDDGAVTGRRGCIGVLPTVTTRMDCVARR